MPADDDRRGVPIFSAIRTFLVVALLFVVYYSAPLNRPLSFRSGLLFGTALVLLAAAVALQVRGILRSRRPRLRAIRALAVATPAFLVVFAATYFTVASDEAGSFTEPLTRTDALYFTLTTFATVGFGDIAPRTELARVLVMIQMVVGLLAVGVIAKVVLGAVRVAEQRRQRTPRGSDDLSGDRAAPIGHEDDD